MNRCGNPDGQVLTTKNRTAGKNTNREGNIVSFHKRLLLERSSAQFLHAILCWVLIKAVTVQVDLLRFIG